MSASRANTLAGRARPRTVTSLALVLALAGCQSVASPAPSGTAAPATSPPASDTQSPPPSGDGRWESAGSMTLARWKMHAAQLGDGRVLVVGPEFNPDGPASTTAEVWDPVTGAWARVASLNKARVDFAAASLLDGRMLVTGGLNDDPTPQSYSSAYLFDGGRASEGWVKVGLMGTARSGPAAATLPDGRVLVAGGYYHVEPNREEGSWPVITLAAHRPNGSSGGDDKQPDLDDVDVGTAGAALATTELFDPATGEWSSGGPRRYARYRPAAVTLADGRVLVVGSLDQSSTPYRVEVDPGAFDSAEIYDPASGQFSLTGRFPSIDRVGLEALGEPGSNPMPEDEPWVEAVGSLVALPDGGAVLIGHAGWWKHVGEISRSFRFDAATDTWAEIGQTFVYVGEPSPEPLWSVGVPDRTGAVAALLGDGRVLVAGGSGPIEGGPGIGYETRVTAAAELFDPVTGAWSGLPSMPEPRTGGAVVVLADGSVLLIGGDGDYDNGNLIVLASAIRFLP
jgi:hypothetical protein